ncbi:MAG: DNA phosphorothioation-associated putative methyltransferase [Candidatus Tectimicrobiota bacterium]
MKVGRHRTAMKRYRLSRPIRLALQAQLIGNNTSFFDYGCGRGDDLRELRALGITCSGWDPVFRPDAERRPADIVNLGYVLNVIEDACERVEALQKAHSITRQLLIIAARLSMEARGGSHQEYQDGYLTKRGTFQKFFTQQELREWIDATLDVSSVAAGPGIFFVFRDESLRQSFLASRYRPRVATPVLLKSNVLYERHGEVLRPLMDFVASRGRLPDNAELPESSRLREIFGSIPQAFSVVRQVTGKDRWEAIAKERAQDLQIYLALASFTGRPRFAVLPPDLQLDVKAFFGTYKRACEVADQLLFSVGDISAIDRACKESTCGKLTPEALYIHTSALPQLAPVLRVYEGCARGYIGDVEGANVVKFNRRQPKISYLSYPDFDRDPHPALMGALVVQLQTFQVHYFDYSSSDSPPILHRKEVFVSADYPARAKFERLTRQEERWGLYENPSTIGTKNKWNQLLAQKSIRLAGHQVVKTPSA